MTRKILIVEDDPNALSFAAYTLRQAGYQVLTASNGVEGLKMAQEEEPDLVLLDVLLPGMDGFEVCHRLKNALATAKLPILMLSVMGRESDKKMGLTVGADQYLTKLIAPAELTASVGRLLEGQVSAETEKEHIPQYLKFWSRDERQGKQKL